jgi:hypothetical protein
LWRSEVQKLLPSVFSPSDRSISGLGCFQSHRNYRSKIYALLAQKAEFIFWIDYYAPQAFAEFVARQEKFRFE